MKKQTITIFTSVALLLLIAGCKKDKEPSKSKTEYIVQSAWKLDAATSSGLDVMPFISNCWKDNTALFVSTAEGTGTGTIYENTDVCSGEPATTPFTWNFETNETVLSMTATLIPGGSGDFNIITLNGTNMIVSQDVNLPPAGMQNVVLTFKH